MGQRLSPLLAAGVLASLVLNVILAVFLFAGRPLPPAFGAGAGGDGGFVVATEHGPDQTPVCFVLRTAKPHLLVYKTDTAGQLQLTSSRDIHCDLLLPDNFMPRGLMAGKARTLPPVAEVCNAVRSLQPPEDKKAEEKEKDKDKDKEKEEGQEEKKDGKKKSR